MDGFTQLHPRNPAFLREAAKPRASVGRATFLLVAMIVGGSGCGASGAATTPDELPTGSSFEDADAPETQLAGNGTCRTDAECTIGRPAPCSFCGGCPQAMMQVEYDALERQAQDCPPLEGKNGPPVACGPCPMDPDRAICTDGECVGVIADAVDQSVDHARCQTDDDCVPNPVDCSECGRCPGEEPVAVMRSEVGSLLAECERHPPVRLDPQAAALGLQRPACSPCPLSPNEPRPVWRAVCKGGSCAVEQAGTEQPYQGGELTQPSSPTP